MVGDLLEELTACGIICCQTHWIIFYLVLLKLLSLSLSILIKCKPKINEIVTLTNHRS